MMGIGRITKGRVSANRHQGEYISGKSVFITFLLNVCLFHFSTSIITRFTTFQGERPAIT